MFADATTVWTAIAAVGSLIVAGGILFSRRSPFNRALRWLWRHNIAEPIGSWFRQQVREVTSEVVDEKLLARNGGTTVPDAIARIDSLRQDTNNRHGQNVAALLAVEEKVDAIALKIGANQP